MEPIKEPVEEKPNIATKLMTEEWKGEEDYKRMIVALQIQNEKYRNELYELGETVNKILDKTKLPQSNKAVAPNLEQQLELLKKQLHNVNQFIEIYQKELNVLSSKKKQEQIDTLSNTQELLKAKNEELTALKKELKQVSHKNKGLEYKLMEFNRKNRAKSYDQQAMQLKELINENKNLKSKLEELQNLQQKKEVWLKNNIQSAKNLQLKIQSQETRLPKIEVRKDRQEQANASLPKMLSEKKIYTKWLESSKEKNHSKLEKELQDLQKINKMIQQKIKATSQQIRELEEQIGKVKERVQQNEMAQVPQPIEELPIPRKEVGCMVSKRIKKSRRDWVGKFDAMRFSDSRSVREESRLFKITHNSAGYLQFHYYAVKEPKRIIVGKLPFDPTGLNGKESTFTVDYPDFIKNARVKINLKTQRILELHVVSNLGLQGEFIIEVTPAIPAAPASKGDKKEKQPVVAVLKEDLSEVNYEMDVKANEAITTVFGSYGYKTDEKKNVTAVWIEGFGVQLIEDFVEELI